MAHQAAVELDQQVVRQPVLDIMPLQCCQRAVTVGQPRHHRGHCGFRFPVSCGKLRCKIVTEQACAKGRTRPCREFRPDRPHAGAVAAIAGEEFIAALARQDDLDVAGGPARQMQRRQNGVIRRRVVAGKRRQTGICQKIRLSIGNIDEIGALGGGETAGDVRLVVPAPVKPGVKSDGIGQDRLTAAVTRPQVGKRGEDG